MLDCPLKWDFSYGGNLLGFSIKSRDPNVYLRRGRAWGLAVAKWHLTGDVLAAGREIITALDEDAAKQDAAGTYDPEAHAELLALLNGCLADYAANAGRITGYHSPEHEITVRIPGRHGGKSSRYRLVVKLDALATGIGGTYIVEHKYRGQLSTLEDIMRARQFRWYAWAHREQTGEEIRGVIVDERLAEIPSPVRFNTDGSVSRVQSCNPGDYLAAFAAVPEGEAALAKNGRVLKTQTCHPRVYVAACDAVRQEIDEEVLAKLAARHKPDHEILAALTSKRWHNREPVLFSPREIDEAGDQIVSAAHLIQLHESGVLYPIRNGNASKCRNCFARDVCLTPTDSELARALFDVRPAKRNRIVGS